MRVKTVLEWGHKEQTDTVRQIGRQRGKQGGSGEGNQEEIWGGRRSFYMQHLALLPQFLASGGDAEQPLGP